MPEFLNTQSFYEELLTMINECEHELVIIVPYIKMTNEIYEAFKRANSRGVETTLVYREKKVNKIELNKLYGLDNMNILHHPNVHCKCYFTGIKVIIGSMNLYDYSIENNREMGILLKARYPGQSWNIDADTIPDNLLLEIQTIINSSEIVKQSNSTAESGFNINIIKNDLQHCEELCTKLNAHFLNKKFSPSIEGNLSNVPISKDYFDHVDVYFDDWRVIIQFMEISKAKRFYNDKGFNDNATIEINGFRLLWNKPQNNFYMYISDDAKNENGSFKEICENWKRGIEMIISAYRVSLKI